MEIIDRAVARLREWNDKVKKPVVTARHSIFKYPELVRKVREKQQERASRENREIPFDGGKVVYNLRRRPPANPLRRKYPMTDMRTTVESVTLSSGRRRNQAWQRQLTPAMPNMPHGQVLKINHLTYQCTMRYIIDSRYFDGTCLTSMSDDMHSDYGGETLEALREREKNPYLVAVSPVRMTLLVKRYTRALCKPFHEITEERYYELLECLPPARMQSDWFFVGEPYYRNLYALCFESDGRYFRAERPIRLSNAEIYRQIREHMEKVNLHPAIVKKASFVKYVNWYKKTVTYIPYYFEYGGKIYFLKNLATRTGSEFGDRRERNEMAALLRNLRGNRYEYCTFYSQKKDIFEFFDWLRKNKYTLEIQGDLFDFADDRSHVDFHGNVCEYSAVFHYRIYSRELFGHIINQLRTVKRYHAWHKRREIR